jgi:hypothetical protein
MDEESRELIRSVVNDVARERAHDDAMLYGCGFYVIAKEGLDSKYIPLNDVFIDGRQN